MTTAPPSPAKTKSILGMFTVETTTEATDLDTDEEEEMGQRKEELVAFYSEHDPTKIATVDELLRDYDFAVLVRTIKQKYGVAPPEWEELAEEEEGADGACTVLSCVRLLASHSLVFVPWFGVSLLHRRGTAEGRGLGQYGDVAAIRESRPPRYCHHSPGPGPRRLTHSLPSNTGAGVHPQERAAGLPRGLVHRRRQRAREAARLHPQRQEEDGGADGGDEAGRQPGTHGHGAEEGRYGFLCSLVWAEIGSCVSACTVRLGGRRCTKIRPSLLCSSFESSFATRSSLVSLGAGVVEAALGRRGLRRRAHALPRGRRAGGVGQRPGAGPEQRRRAAEHDGHGQVSQLWATVVGYSCAWWHGQ